MANRREFLKASLITTAAVAVSGRVMASTGVKFPKGLIYTKKEPGKWASKARVHVPIVKLGAGKVTVTTPHPMTRAHYIVRHTLVSRDGKVLGETTFKPTDKLARSVFQLPVKPGEYYATSFCNLHDFWVTVFTV